MQPDTKARQYIAHYLTGFIHMRRSIKQCTAFVKSNEATMDITAASCGTISRTLIAYKLL